jgi:hypothetical protein
MQSSCAHQCHAPKIFPKRAHKRAFSRLVRSFSQIADTVLKKVEKHECIFFKPVVSNSRVDLECDKHGVGGGSMHFARSFSQIADKVLKKVEKHKHVQHVQMATRGVHLSQLLEA